jgi:predicted helicase
LIARHEKVRKLAGPQPSRLSDLKKPAPALPPRRKGQGSANDNNANQAYPSLDQSLRNSYVARSSAALSRNLYDAYIRAFRWASMRIGDRGVIAFVSNGGWLNANAYDGMRLTLADEFDAIHVLNLRGNQRTAGEQSRKEGGKVFGGGSGATVAITILVKDPAHTGPADISYTDIGDYLTTDDKLSSLSEARSITGLSGTRDIRPNGNGDWVDQRRGDFAQFLPLAGLGGLFAQRVPGVSTNRDAWVQSFSREALNRQVETSITYFNDLLTSRPDAGQIKNPASISWSAGLEQRLRARRPLPTDNLDTRITAYRPFQKLRLSKVDGLIERPGVLREFPNDHHNLAIVIAGPGPHADPAVLMVDDAPNLHLVHSGSALPRYHFEIGDGGGMLPIGESGDGGHTRIDNITDFALTTFRDAYGDAITKDQVFAYVYGLLHSPDYRDAYAADLKKMLPRVPLVTDPWPYVEAGRRLTDLHLGYETVEPYPLIGLDVDGPTGDDAYAFFRVEKMALAKVRDPTTGRLVTDRTRVVYNSRITLAGIPEEAYRYQLGSRSAIEWIIDRYQIKTDKASGIVTDPNDWSREVGDPRYVLDLLARIVTVSLETMKVVDGLPPLDVLATLAPWPKGIPPTLEVRPAGGNRFNVLPPSPSNP